MLSTESILQILAIVLSLLLIAWLFFVPSGRIVSRVVYYSSWVSAAGMFLMSRDFNTAGFLLLAIGIAGWFYFFSEGGQIYVRKDC